MIRHLLLRKVYFQVQLIIRIRKSALVQSSRLIVYIPLCQSVCRKVKEVLCAYGCHVCVRMFLAYSCPSCIGYMRRLTLSVLHSVRLQLIQYLTRPIRRNSVRKK